MFVIMILIISCLLQEQPERTATSMCFTTSTVVVPLGLLSSTSAPRKATINEILSKDKLRLQKGDIPKELIKNITKAINNSNRVRPNIKKQIDLSKI